MWKVTFGVSKNNLQDPEKMQYFTPNNKMAKVFGADKMNRFAMSKFLTAHLPKMWRNDAQNYKRCDVELPRTIAVYI